MNTERSGKTAGRIVFDVVVMVCLALGGTGIEIVSAHDDVHGRPHFKGSPASPTAVMKRLQADSHAAQSLAQLNNIACTNGMADIYPCNNIDLMAFLPLTALGGSKANDIWGWTDPASGREFALVGLYEGTAFVEITDPSNPVYLGLLPAHTTGSTWRDIKTYANHAFIVSEASGYGMQIYDLSRLLQNPTFTANAQYNGFGNAHNIVINEATGIAYAVGTGTCSGGLHMVDITNPTIPTAAGCFSSDGYTHDAQCVVYAGPDTGFTGHEICFNSNEDTLTIVDVTNKANPAQISRVTYPGVGYTHQGWLTPDHKYFLFDDELDEQNSRHNTRTRIFNLSNLGDPVFVGYFDNTTAAIDHNQYVKENHVYQANYRAGLRILEITDPDTANLTEIAFFDIYPSSNSAFFNGAWSTYPYFPSNNVVVSGIEQGLFILRPNLSGGPPPTGEAPAAPDILNIEDQGNGTALITYSDNSDNETGFELQREKQHKKRGWTNGTTINLDSDTDSYTDSSGSGDFRYRIRAANQFGVSEWSTWVEVTVTASGGGGGNTKCHPVRGC